MTVTIEIDTVENEVTSQSTVQRERLPNLRVDPQRALAAIETLLRDPEDIAQGFVIVDALAGQAPLRVLTRFRSHPMGQKLLAQRPDLLESLRNRQLLARMPMGSLACAYLTFIDNEGLTADGLVRASVNGRGSDSELQSDFMFVRNRIRDSHDLWHAVTGYQADVVGELALLSFNVAQLRNPGIAVLVLAALARYRKLAFSKVVTRAFFHGLRSAWLPPVHWEALLPLPLDEVRALLCVEPQLSQPSHASR